MENQEILLESGINEVEIMEFYLGEQSFGINVSKIRQIVRFENAMLTRLPDSHPAALGVVMIRGETLPLIDLGLALKRSTSVFSEESDKRLVLITEFNNKVTGFLISGVNRIHRISWDALQPMSYFSKEHYNVNFTGSVNIEDNEILVIDIERVLGEIDVEINFESEEEKVSEPEPVKERQDLKLVFVEDSNYIRQTVLRSLKAAGYVEIEVFDNGKSALDYLVGMKDKAYKGKKNLSHYVNIVVTDIEMPQMDGLTLCNHLKKEVSAEIPVVIYSSLINEQMILKCGEVRADGYTAKPRISKLIQLIDSLTLKKGPPPESLLPKVELAGE